MNPTVVFQIILFAIMTIYILVKEVVIPKRNHRKNGNPINIDRFYQEFKDFKETQGKWNDKMEKEIEKLEDKK